MGVTINKFNVPYPDFKLGETIDPEQFDANNEEVITKVNEVIDVVNTDKLSLDGDFKGTWNGKTFDTIGDDILITRIHDMEKIVDSIPSTVTKATLRLQGEMAHAIMTIDALKRTEYSARSIFGDDFTGAPIALEVDYTKTFSEFATAIGATTMTLDKLEGIYIGQDYTILDASGGEDIRITAIDTITKIVTFTPALTRAYIAQADVVRSNVTIDTVNTELKLDEFTTFIVGTTLTSNNLTSTTVTDLLYPYIKITSSLTKLDFYVNDVLDKSITTGLSALSYRVDGTNLKEGVNTIEARNGAQKAVFTVTKTSTHVEAGKHVMRFRLSKTDSVALFVEHTEDVDMNAKICYNNNATYSKILKGV